MNTALLIIDVQQALCSGEDEVFESRRVIERINQVSRLARSAQSTVIIIQYEEQDGPFEYGTEGWALDTDLETGPADIYARKTTPDSFHNTELHALLQARGIKELVICGLQSEYCVDSTTRSALALGYPVTLVSDGHSTLDNGIIKAAQITAHHNLTLGRIGGYGPAVRVIPAAEVRIQG